MRNGLVHRDQRRATLRALFWRVTYDFGVDRTGVKGRPRQPCWAWSVVAGVQMSARLRLVRRVRIHVHVIFLVMSCAGEAARNAGCHWLMRVLPAAKPEKAHPHVLACSFAYRAYGIPELRAFSLRLRVYRRYDDAITSLKEMAANSLATHKREWSAR